VRELEPRPGKRICELIRDSLAAEHINALAVHNGADALKVLDTRGPLLLDAAVAAERR